MRWLALCTLLVLATAAHAGIMHSWWKQLTSVFYLAQDPPYDVIKNYDVFQERMYPHKKWACAEGKNYSSMTSLKWFLDQYLSGFNDKSVKMRMNQPVTTEYKVGNNGEKTYDVCYFITEVYQDYPPQPGNPIVKIKNRPDIMVFARTQAMCSDYENAWMEKATTFAEIINRDTGKPINLNHMYWAGYNPSKNAMISRCEVWFPVSM